MLKNSAVKAPTEKHLAPGQKSKQTLEAVLASRTVQAAISAGNSEFIFPKMSGAAAAELMKAAGILTPTGKLTKAYR